MAIIRPCRWRTHAPRWAENLRSYLAIALLLAALLPSSPAQSQYARLGFGQFTHTRWTADDGAPVGIERIAQTPDGFLWLGTVDGLYRFDGVIFERIAPPAGSPMERAAVRSLMTSRSGELWVGFNQNGGVAVYRNGQLQDMRLPRPEPITSALAETPDGAIWASSETRRLLRLRHGRWEELQDSLALPDQDGDVRILGLRVTPDGTLWVLMAKHGTIGLISYLAAGGDRFQPMPGDFGPLVGATVDPQGRLWVSDDKGTRLLGGPGRIAFPVVPGLSRATLAFDTQGGIWGTSASVGIFHIPDAAKARRTADDGVRRFTAADGLTSNVTFAAFSDREGNVWIATEQGLDQFRPASALVDSTISANLVKGFSMAQAADRTLYISSMQGVFHILPGRPPQRILDYHLDGICAAHDEGVWAFTDKQLLRFKAGRWETLPPPPGNDRTGICTEDRFRRLWITLGEEGRLMWRDARGAWHSPGPRALKSDWWDLITTPTGDLTFKTKGNFVRVIGNQQLVRKLSPPDSGEVAMVSAGISDTFIGTANALLRMRDGKLARIDGSRFPWITELRWLVQTRRGETWLWRRDGMSRVKTSDLDRAFDDPRAPLARTLFDRNDGLTSGPQQVGIRNVQAGVDAEGRVWFLTRTGASFIDPARLRPNRLPPPVLIRSVTSGGAVYRDPVSLTLPPGTHTIDIAYTALSLSVPQRVRFRYRLEGVDDDWIDPGTRRLASYANLGPGQYRFRVIAANNDGVWNETGATLAFEIRPTFLQGWPFRLLCGLALLALLWLAYSLRLRVVANRIRMRMTERMEEREHIAREMHDTLLQSVQALTLRFQLAVDDLPAAEPARPTLEEALDRADDVIAEGRDRLRTLRPLSDAGDIGQILADIVEKQAFGPAVQVSIATVGLPRNLDPRVTDEVARIAGEAIFNVRRHAHASHLMIEIGFHASFSLRFIDDGVGIDPAVMTKGGRDGHYGLPGMRERASKLNGELTIASRPGGGTELTLIIPGGIAYKASRLLGRFGRKG